MIRSKYKPLIEKLYSNSGLHRIIANTSWLMGERVVRLIIGIFISVWVARYLGPDQYGLLSYVGAFVGLFAVFAHLGLNNLTVHRIVETPEQTNELLGTTFVLQLIGGIVTLVLCVIAGLILHSDDELTRTLIFFLAFSPIISSFNVINLWHQSQFQSYLTVIARSAALILIPLLKVGLILIEAPLTAFVLVGVVEAAIGAIGLIVVYHLKGNSMRAWQFRYESATALLKKGWPLLLSAVAIAIYMRIDQILLREMMGNSEVGIYSVAVRISEIWYFVPIAIMASLFPVLTAAKKKNETHYYRRFKQTFRLMLLLSLTVAVLMTFLSDWLVLLLYGEPYAEAGSVLAIHIWAGVPVAVGLATTPWLIIEGLTNISFQKTVFGAVVNVVLNLILIPLYGAVGAAIATVIAYFCATLLWHVIDPRMRKIGILQLKALLPGD